MEFLNYSIPLLWFAAGVIGIPTALLGLKEFFKYAAIEGKKIELVERIRDEVCYCHILTTGHRIHFRKPPKEFNPKLVTVWYADNKDVDFDKYQYWGKLVDESLPNYDDWEIWHCDPGWNITLPEPRHILSSDQLSYRTAQSRVIKAVRVKVGGKT